LKKNKRRLEEGSALGADARLLLGGPSWQQQGASCHVRVVAALVGVGKSGRNIIQRVVLEGSFRTAAMVSLASARRWPECKRERRGGLSA